jgi:hypothetical protein
MLDSLTAQFAAQFCTGTVAKCNALTRPNLQLDAVAFMDTVKSVIVAPGSIRGVWMEYGLNQGPLLHRRLPGGGDDPR